MKRMICLLLSLLLMLSLGVSAFAEDVMFCRFCGKQIPADSLFCQHCGKSLTVSEEAAPAVFEQPKPAEPAAMPAPIATAAPVVTAAPAPVVVAQQVSAETTQQAVPGPFNTTSAGGSVVRKVAITKSPTSESVPYGGACMFIAHAVNATSVTWYLASSDASLIIPAGDGPAYVAGLSVSGVNNDTLYLSGIPASMNGCLVQACFTGEGGPVYTDIARIWTYQPASSCAAPKKDDSIWTLLAQWDPWWDYYSCYDPWWGYDPCYDPWWGYGWSDPCPPSPPAPVSAPNPPDVSHAITRPDGRSVAPELPSTATTVKHIAHSVP